MPGIHRDAAEWTLGHGQGTPFMLHNPRLKDLGGDPGREPSSRARPALDSSLNPLERPHLGDARPRSDSVDRQGDSEAGGARRAGARWMTRSFRGGHSPVNPAPAAGLVGCPGWWPGRRRTGWQSAGTRGAWQGRLVLPCVTRCLIQRPLCTGLNCSSAPEPCTRSLKPTLAGIQGAAARFDKEEKRPDG